VITISGKIEVGKSGETKRIIAGTKASVSGDLGEALSKFKMDSNHGTQWSIPDCEKHPEGTIARLISPWVYKFLRTLLKLIWKDFI